MSTLTTVLAVVTAVVAVADWIAVARSRKDVETWLKPATLALLIGTVIAAGALDHSAGVWLVIALVLGMIGDIALLDDTVEWRFIAGLAAFLVGHLGYVVCFARVGLENSGWWVVGAVVVLVAFVVARGVLPAAVREGGPGLGIAVATYMAVIAAMTITGWATASLWIAVGAAIFVCSDTTLALNKFVRPLSWARPTIMVTYHVGQALIAAGVLVRVTT
ncbi:MAG TPA: lysoplasmalogenase [Nocardioides sp.]|nr:lysoplasmalogenase [Nocardioides sp.]